VLAGASKDGLFAVNLRVLLEDPILFRKSMENAVFLTKVALETDFIRVTKNEVFDKGDGVWALFFNLYDFVPSKRF